MSRKVPLDPKLLEPIAPWKPGESLLDPTLSVLPRPPTPPPTGVPGSDTTPPGVAGDGGPTPLTSDPPKVRAFGRWVKPFGFHKRKQMTEVKRAAQMQGLRSVAELTALRDHAKSDKIRLEAARILLQYAIGMPKPMADEPEEEDKFEDVSDAEIEEVLG